MKVRYLAQELFRWTVKVEDLERALAILELGGIPHERTRLKTELLQAKRELAHYRAVLESKKETTEI